MNQKSIVNAFLCLAVFFLASCDEKRKINVVSVTEFKDSVRYEDIQHSIDSVSNISQPLPRMPAPQVAPGEYPTNEDLVGYGYNSSTLQPLGKVVENDKAYLDTSNFSGQTVTKILERVTSKSSLYNKLGIDAKASLKYGAFKGSASMSLLQTSSVNSYSDYLLLKVSVINSPLILRQSILTNYALAVANASKERFKERYGNEFFYGKITGGEMVCLFEFQSNSSTSKKNIKAAVDIAVKTMVAKGSASTAMEKLDSALSETVSTKVYFFRKGDEGQLVSNNIDSIAKYADQFPAKVQNNTGKPVVIALLSKPIITVENMPISIKARDYLAFNKQSYFLDSIASQILKIQDANANYSFVSDNSNQNLFVSTTIDSATISLEKNKASINSLKLLYDNCETAIGNCSSNAPPIAYDTYMPKSREIEVEAEKPTPKEIELVNGRILLAEIPFGETKTIEFRGTWKMNQTGLPGDNAVTHARRVCGPPTHIEGPGFPFPRPARVMVPLQSRIRIIQVDIKTDGLVDNTLWDANRPFNSRTGVKLYVEPEFSVTQCNPAVKAFIY
jgi:hypothetical protein